MHKSNCLLNSDRECGYCTCGADAKENTELYIKELESEIERLTAKIDSLQKDLKFAWEEKNREVEEIARSLNWEEE